jgi:hypothetical protein
MKSERRDIGTDVGERNMCFRRHCSVSFGLKRLNRSTKDLSFLLACD